VIAFFLKQREVFSRDRHLCYHAWRILRSIYKVEEFQNERTEEFELEKKESPFKVNSLSLNIPF
jgi:hypothetical protein